MAAGQPLVRALVARPVGVSLRTSCLALAAVLSAVAALLVASAALVHQDPLRLQLQLSMAGVALVAALLVRLGWQRMPAWAFFALHAAVSAALGLSVGAVGSGTSALALGGLFALLLLESFFVLSWAEAGFEMALGLGALVWGLSVHADVAAADVVLQVGVLAIGCTVCGWLVRAVDRADLDALTGLPNRRGVQRRGEALALRARRGGVPVALALVDVDRFKAVNDELGHAAGDELLRTVARLGRAGAPAAALFGRWGGDEFLLLVPTHDPRDAAAVLDGVRAGLPAGRSLSAGVALWEDGDLLDAVHRADQALYAVKRAGRGSTRVHDGAAPGVAPDRVPVRAGAADGVARR